MLIESIFVTLKVSLPSQLPDLSSCKRSKERFFLYKYIDQKKSVNLGTIKECGQSITSKVTKISVIGDIALVDVFDISESH